MGEGSNAGIALAEHVMGPLAIAAQQSQTGPSLGQIDPSGLARVSLGRLSLNSVPFAVLAGPCSPEHKSELTLLVLQEREGKMAPLGRSQLARQPGDSLVEGSDTDALIVSRGAPSLAALFDPCTTLGNLGMSLEAVSLLGLCEGVVRSLACLG